MAEYNIAELDRDAWLQNTFPEWGTWLNEEIDAEVVPEGKLKMWWLGCTGIWFKTPGGANFTVDFWEGRGRSTKKQPTYEEIEDFQIIRLTGARTLPPFLRMSPIVIDPFAMTKMDVLFASHIHDDHIDPYVAAAAVKLTEAVFVGPKLCVEKWLDWGVPKERTHVLNLGDVYTFKDVEVTAVEAFDRTALITMPPGGDMRGKMPPDMNERALNYVIKTPGGTVYHTGDSHFSDRYFKHGKDHDIDVCFTAYGENAPGATDKITASDCLRVAENLRSNVLIPYHYDMWANQHIDPNELELLYKFNQYRLKFKLFIWQVGGKFTYPDDKDNQRYKYPKGGEDAFTDDNNLPFPAFL